ncbi:polysaccharide pyruvyl transferase family protein [Agromyces sp. MMS24-K17]|uniref:polysaccharide pyruvyl transferase family protein n=1 Tax=Agromyces sp. MMS24-K17 TaxID=3372850 RepID=UPI003755364B
MNPRRIARKAQWKAAEIAAASAAGASRDRRRIAEAIATSSASARPATAPHVLIASAGAGNIGDQAMVEAFVEHVDGPVVVITRAPDDFAVPPGAAGRVRFEVLPVLVYGAGRERLADLRRFGELLAGARSLSIIGADIMDGRYSPRASVRRSTLAEAAARAGLPSRILGFSWNGSPERRARAALHRAGAAGVDLLLRDPVSAVRARTDGVPRVIETADLVFLATTVDPSAADELLGAAPAGDAPEASDPPVALVNVSALVGRSLDQAAEYGRIIAALRADGYRVVLVPHVSRPSSDDVAACRQVAAAFTDDPDVRLVERLLTPAQIRGLAARTRLTVTGRMHLAIMSLHAGVPAITLATQGKVEGLMRLVGVPELCVEPGPDLAGRVLDVVGRLGDGGRARRAVQEAPARLRALAERNVAGLGAEPSTTATAEAAAGSPSAEVVRG